MLRTLPLVATPALAAQPAFAGVPIGMPSPSILGLAAAGVVAAIYLALRKR